MAELQKITAVVHTDTGDTEEDAIREAAKALGESAREGMEAKVFTGREVKDVKPGNRVGTPIGSFALAADPHEPDKNFRVEFTKKR
jgi:hypothetical protein